MNPILKEIHAKFGEWIEMAGEDSPALIIDMLCVMLKRERERVEYFQKINEVNHSQLRKLARPS